MQAVKTKDVLAYVTMPRIVPRVKELFSSGFSYVSFWMAHIYLMVRLLPPHHPYLLKENVGRYGVRHVIAEASRNLKFSRNNIDQILVYFGLLGGVVMLVMQFVLLVYVVFISPVMAFSWFETVNPTQDVAFNLLDRVFGLPGIYCDSAAVCTAYSADPDGDLVPGPPLPLPFHAALHDLFQFYSTALMSIAVLIVLYFIVVIVFETATTGTPFGQRFQNVWVPIRLVVALGLLLPVNYGLSSGQYIVLYAAKFGSSFATVGWNEFNAGIKNHPMFIVQPEGRPIGERYTMLAIPETPDISSLVEAMSLVHACAFAYVIREASGKNVTDPSAGINYPDYKTTHTLAADEHTFRVIPFLVKQPTGGMVAGPITGTPIVGDPAPRLWVPDRTTVDYMDALGFYYGNDIIIRFGEYALNDTGGPQYEQDIGNVKPLCGDIRVSVTDLRDPGGALAGPSRGGADQMLKTYYDMVLQMWFDDLEMRQFARSYVMIKMVTQEDVLQDFCSSNETSGNTLSGLGTGYPGFHSTAADCKTIPPSADWKQEKIREYADDLKIAVKESWGNHVNNSIYDNFNSTIASYGWGGAGVWYSKIAEVNGGWMDGVEIIPYMDNYPLVMEEVREQNKQNNENIDLKTQFTPTVAAESGNDSSEQFKLQQFIAVANALAAVYLYWNGDSKNFDMANRTDFQNIFMDVLNRLLGTSGIAAIRTANAHLHPLAQLTAVGKGLVDSAIRNLAGSTGFAFLGGMAGALEHNKTAAASNAASQVLLSTAFMGLTAGFILFYILPFLPFVYFFFALASWLKAIFEAMVGVPLWALAHLRIDGEGLPGDAAQNGYFLILEIFIRPILTVVGLVAAVIIFSTQVRILNLIWDLVTVNVSGNSVGLEIGAGDILDMTAPISGTATSDTRYQRGIVDQFFFTVIYTIVCYMSALASFKLIDRIPDNILRWAGAGVSAFGDINQDQIESLNRYAAMGGFTFGSQASEAVVKLGGGLGGSLGGVAKQAVQGTGGGGGPRPPGQGGSAGA